MCKKHKHLKQELALESSAIQSKHKTTIKTKKSNSKKSTKHKPHEAKASAKLTPTQNTVKKVHFEDQPPKKKISLLRSKQASAPPSMQKTVDTGFTTKVSNRTERKTGEFIGYMCPSGISLHHPMADLLLEHAKNGCKVNCGANWSREQIEAAIDKGPHIKKQDAEAASYAWEEAVKKQEDGYCDIHKWSDIKDHHPPQLKISPIAAMPHKSRPFRIIQDLSFGITLNNKRLPSVNETTTTSSPEDAFKYIGSALPRLIFALAQASEAKPAYFAKGDVEDGYWRIFMEADGRWNFSYVLPPTPEHPDVHIVVPKSIQMGWVESMNVFCTAAETGRDSIERLWNNESLPKHKLEGIMMNTVHQQHNTTIPKLPPITSDEDIANFLKVIENYVDDYCALAQPNSLAELEHLTRGILHGIDSIFPDGISVKKLLKEGAWDTSKELLGWLFDGISKTIQLPKEKLDKLVHIISSHLRQGYIVHKELERAHGKIRHATIAMPWTNGLLTPINTALSKKVKIHNLKSNNALRQTLEETLVMIRLIAKNPTKVKLLVPSEPEVIIFTDASKEGIGGTIHFLNGSKKPLVFRIPHTEEIKQAIASQTKGENKTRVSDCEALALVTGLLIAVLVCNLKEKSIALFCDNTPTVGWVRRLAAKSQRAARLMRILAIIIHIAGVTPLISLSIAGSDNKEADYTTRHMKVNNRFLTDYEFLTNFNHAFPHSQGYNLVNLSPKLTCKLMNEMQTKPSRIDSWLQLPLSGTSTGNCGYNIVEWTAPTPSSAPSLNQSSANSKALQQGSALATMVDAGKLKLRQYKSRFLPSERPSWWRDTPFAIPYTTQTES